MNKFQVGDRVFHKPDKCEATIVKIDGYTHHLHRDDKVSGSGEYICDSLYAWTCGELHLILLEEREVRNSDNILSHCLKIILV